MNIRDRHLGLDCNSPKSQQPKVFVKALGIFETAGTFSPSIYPILYQSVLPALWLITRLEVYEPIPL